MMKQQLQQLLTVQEAATLFKVREPTIQRWCRLGQIPALKRGKSWRIRWDDTMGADVRMIASASEAAFTTPPAATPASPGWHGLLVVDHDLALEDALAPLRLQVHSLNDLRLVRFSLSFGNARDGKANLSALMSAWKNRLASFSRDDRVVILVVTDEDFAFRTVADSDEWEDYLNRSVRDRPLTIVCVRDDRWGPHDRVAGWQRSFSAHDMVWFQSRASSLHLAGTARVPSDSWPHP